MDVMILESEEELSTLFKEYLSRMGIISVMVSDEEEAINAYIRRKIEGKEFDAVVIDTDLKEYKRLQVAKKIRESDPFQRLILITTSIKDKLPAQDLEAAGIRRKDVLTMPFDLSKFSTVLVE